MKIRRAVTKDIPYLLKLLSQVLEVHVKIRPDVFNRGTTKFSEDELIKMVKDDQNPIYVYEDNDAVLAYAFCEIKNPSKLPTLKPVKTLFIEDFCVDENSRNNHIGESLFNFVKQEAKRLGCDDIKLNVWAGNDIAIKFYEKMGLKIRSSVMEIKL